MKNVRNLGTACALAMLIASGMVAFGPTLHAAGVGSDRSQEVHCQLLQRAIDAATAVFGADSALVIYLQEQYAANSCGE
jgi:hypothetical protein